MNEYVKEGTVTEITDVSTKKYTITLVVIKETVEGKNGTFEKNIPFSFFNKSPKDLRCNVGDKVEIKFDVSGNFSSKTNRWFCNINGWFLSVLDDNNTQQKPPPENTHTSTPLTEKDNDDDIPF